MVTVVGIGADGWHGLSEAAREELRTAEVVLGSTRQLAQLRDVAAERVPWPSPMLPALQSLLDEHAGRAVCVLASGDPMFFGVGSTLVRMLGAGQVRVFPQASSLSLACARMGWALDRVEVVSLVGRPVEQLHPALQPDQRVLVLSADGSTPAAIAELLTARGYPDSRMTVLERLGATEERERTGKAREWAGSAADALNIVAIEVRADEQAPLLPRTPGLPDEAFEHDGQLTKREVRAITLAHLAPVPGQLLWDVGSGAASVAIEWMRAHPSCRAVAFEQRADRADRSQRNAGALGVPALEVVRGSAPEALQERPEHPAAVFVGGGVTRPGVLDACWDALAPGGRLVANAVTVEAEAVLAQWQGRLGGDLVRTQISRGSPVGSFTGWRAMMPVTTWKVTKP
ncbi:precorrin-6y C5,15-methyltransferase (decarboxylating) subunit CbiE [Saccharopolyspora sp. HNM0983]|uniref:Precorrin-6y C5,15-methyltransferase (Decarboxylating) subunit CbiE n=1 Tax=Saccharopolyspora montiporae TaxID=2781240 RepID=A0A929B8X5_9PSEU|nr:precorrin-6y C5,15-methyltransferase (decarboxylating) subunit CbiE [Saccharopolyspora sp. HNM0983]MBE9373338.1 precorrin-6y C5,15-methyltransferase (decarboxylating) subunit CbiE [Saccharopolyspora sp. HNM0983]